MPKVRGFSGERARLIWAALRPIINQMIDSLVASLLRQLPAASSTTPTAAVDGGGSGRATTVLDAELNLQLIAKLEEQARHVIAERLGLVADDVKAIRHASAESSAGTATGGVPTPEPGGEQLSGNSPTEYSGQTKPNPASASTPTKTPMPSNDPPHSAGGQASGSVVPSEMEKAKQFAAKAAAAKAAKK